MDLAYLGKQTLEQALAKAQAAANSVVNFGKATKPFAFTVPKPADKDSSQVGRRLIGLMSLTTGAAIGDVAALLLGSAIPSRRKSRP